MTGKKNWASGVLLRAIAIPNEDERIAAGPALLARHFGFNLSHDNLPIKIENGFGIASMHSPQELGTVVQTTRVGISQAKDLPWRWYLKDSRSVSKRAKGDRCPPISKAWNPDPLKNL